MDKQNQLKPIIKTHPQPKGFGSNAKSKLINNILRNTIHIYKIIQETNNSLTRVLGEKNMKYTQEVKDKAVQAAKDGKSLKEIKDTIGPNPKAVQRYLAKEGIEYKDLRKTLVEAGTLKPSINKSKKAKEADQKRKEQYATKQDNNAVPTGNNTCSEEVIEG